MAPSASDCGSGTALVTRLLSAVAPVNPTDRPVYPAVLSTLNSNVQIPATKPLLSVKSCCAVPGLHLIVTSQAPLALAAERVVRLDARAVPPGPLPAAQALRFGAVALFTERAQGVDRHFSLADTNAAAVIALCGALDGLALAIELAAARVHLLGVQRLLAGMPYRLRLLTRNPNRTAPGRQQTLRATLEWSHDLLDPPEHTVFRRLAVMAGSASLSLVQQVVADPPEAVPAPAGALDEWAVIDALGVLVERCLVTLLGSDDGSEPRCRLLES